MIVLVTAVGCACDLLYNTVNNVGMLTDFPDYFGNIPPEVSV